MRKGKTKIIMLLLLFSIMAFLGYIGYMWYSFSSALKKQGEQWFNEEFLPLSFKGTVLEKEKSEKQEFFVTLWIKTEDKTFSYGLCVNKDETFRSFVQQGDSVIKYSDNAELTFIKENGTKKSFKLPFCD